MAQKFKNQIIYYTSIESKNFSLVTAATERGLCFVGSSPVDFEEFKEWTKKNFQSPQLKQDDEGMNFYAKQLLEYFSGMRTEFSLPLDPIGTDFQKNVWEQLKAIPYGQTTSYGVIAEQIGKKPQASRAVGSAIGKNPIMIVVPCHRVLSQDKKLTGFGGGLQMKRDLLSLEGSTWQENE